MEKDGMEKEKKVSLRENTFLEKEKGKNMIIMAN